MPLAAGLVVVLALAALSLVLGRANLHAAENARLNQRAQLTKQLGSYVETAYDPQKLRAEVARAPFNQAMPMVNELLLQQFQVTPTGDPNIIVALFDRNGHSLAARPAQNGLQVSMLGDAWSRALHGEVAEAQTFRVQNELVRAYAVPIGTGTPWAVLVAVPRDESGQQFHQKLRGLGPRPGGMSTVDAHGIALTSWNPALIGTKLLSDDEMDALRTQSYRRWKTGHGDDEIVTIGAIDHNSGYAQIFRQRTADLYFDLRSAQQLRDLSLLAVVVVALAGLALLGLQRERSARRAAARLHAMLGNAHDLVLVVAADGTASFVSPAIRTLLGCDPDEWTGRALLDLVHPGDADRMAALLDDPSEGRLLNVRLRAEDGSVRWFDVESTDLTGNRRLSGILLTCHDVGERKVLQDELSFQASHDELTGLANRGIFSERIRAATSPGSATKSFAVLFIDLDHFKPVNDTLGHDAGDRVLQTFASRLTAAVRDGDLVCRFGGDEFGVFLDDIDEATARDVAQRIGRAARAPIAIGATLVNIDASVGVTLADGPATAAGSAVRLTSEQLIREADEAMYLAKQAGRGRYAVYPGRSLAGPRSAASEDPTPAIAPAPTATPVRAARTPLATQAPTRSLRQRLLHVLPLLIAGALVIGIAGLGSAQEARATSTAETKRLSERSDLTLRVGEYAAGVIDPRRLMQAVDSAPWNLDDLGNNAAVLQAFSHSPAAGLNSIVALSSPDGTISATYPTAATVRLDQKDPAWKLARTGRPGLSRAQELETTPRIWYVLPVQSHGRIAAILLIGQSSRDAEVERMMQAVGSLGLGDGGISGVDASGNAFVSWDTHLIGRHLLDRSDLAGLPVGQVKRIDRGGQTMLITSARTNGDPNPRYIVFSQRTSVFFGDLRNGQQTRNVLLIVLVCAAIVGLAVLNRRRELAEQRSRARLQALLHNAHDLLVTVDQAGVTTFVSSAVEGLLGHDALALPGRSFLDLVADDDRDRILAALGNDGAVVGHRVLSDVRLLTADGSSRWFDVGVADLRNNPAVAGLLLTCHEIGERKRLQDELRHRAHHDVLTGLPNRATFAAHLAAITGAGDRTFAVLFVDLDHFKPVNDRLGHDAGDAVLQAVAGRLESAVRHTGARPSDIVSRLGGDEFAAVLTDVDEGEARQVADRILAAIREPIAAADGTVRIGATIGIALSNVGTGTQEDRQPDTVVRRADTAMYQAKAAGRGRYAIFGA